MQIEPFEMKVSSQEEFDTVIDFLEKHDYHFHSEYSRYDYSSSRNIISFSKCCGDDELMPRENIFVMVSFQDDDPIITFEQFHDKYIDPPKDASYIFNINNDMLNLR